MKAERLAPLAAPWVAARMGSWHRVAILELGLVLPGCVCEHLAEGLFLEQSYRSLTDWDFGVAAWVCKEYV